jgi:hypothetical protein
MEQGTGYEPAFKMLNSGAMIVTGMGNKTKSERASFV